MTQITLERPTPTDAAELGRICYDAFKDIHERHGFLPDFPNVEFAQAIIAGNIASEGTFGVAAYLDGTPAGSNFLHLWDEVGGIGPITVDPGKQGHGLGRMLMTSALEHAAEARIEGVRLVQDAFNTTSMSLYASVGFDTKAPLAALNLKPAAKPDPRVRELSESDLEAADRLCQGIYKVSRRNELAGGRAGRMGIKPLVIERDGRIRGYLVPAFVGHGVAENEEDMLALLGEAARISRFPVVQLCPLTSGSLFRKALAAGHTLRKMLNLMALGPYQEPDGVWTPSILF